MNSHEHRHARAYASARTQQGAVLTLAKAAPWPEGAKLCISSNPIYQLGDGSSDEIFNKVT